MHWLEDSCGKTSWTIAGKHALSPSTLNPCTAPWFLHCDAAMSGVMRRAYNPATIQMA